MKRSILISLLVLCQTLAVYAQNKPASEEIIPGTTITGKVMDASTDEPLSGVLIVETVENDTAAYRYTFTDKDGCFSYQLYGRDHLLKVAINGYQSVKVPLKKTFFEIKLEKLTSSGNYPGNDVVYDIVDSSDGTNIRVVKPEELPDDHEIFEFIPLKDY